MRKSIFGVLLLAGLLGWSAPPSQPTSSPTQAPVATSTPAPTATASATPAPTASATPTPEAASTDLSSEEGISNLRDLIDKQVSEKVLTAKEVEAEGEKITIWSGADGIRRIDVKKTEGQAHESAQYYFQGRHLFSFGGDGSRPGDDGTAENYTFWAGISDDEKLVGPPFQFLGGKPAPYPEDDVREREDVGIRLHQKYAN